MPAAPRFGGRTTGRPIVLERTPQTVHSDIEPERHDEGPPAPATAGGFMRRAWQFFVGLSFSSLTRRIIFLNLTGLLALVVGILYLSQFRAGLIDARIQSLLVQGEIIAAAIAASATVDPDSITIDPERLLDLQAGETYDPSDDAMIDFTINPERVGPVLRRLVSPTNTRARIFDRDGSLHPRQPHALRRAALRSAAAGRRPAQLFRAALDGAAALARQGRSADLSRARAPAATRKSSSR